MWLISVNPGLLTPASTQFVSAQLFSYHPNLVIFFLNGFPLKFFRTALLVNRVLPELR